jgi:chemosensory pili system protein ChpA (sensor histidine kinase/response regulator)
VNAATEVAPGLSGVRDEIDSDVLPIFLEEAAELFPQAGEQLRAWQRNPADRGSANALRRTLHTFKGSARMAGAMRVGELTHLMESRFLEGDRTIAPTSELFEALESDLDRLSFLLDRLNAGDYDAPLPPDHAPAHGASAGAAVMAAPTPGPALPATLASAAPAGGAARATGAVGMLAEVPESALDDPLLLASLEVPAEDEAEVSALLAELEAHNRAAEAEEARVLADEAPECASPAFATQAAATEAAPEVAATEVAAIEAAAPEVAPIEAAAPPVPPASESSFPSAEEIPDGAIAAALAEIDELLQADVVAQTQATPPASPPAAEAAPRVVPPTQPPEVVPAPPPEPLAPLPLAAALRAAAPAVHAHPAVAAEASASAPAEPEIRERAMLRVRADVVDRLVNEAGEVSIARARIDGELRSLKNNLFELTNSVIRLRAQVREVEMHAETQIQSRLTQVHESASGFDPLEFDRFTRFQELTRSLAESINDVSTVQQALLKNLDDADAALVAQGRLSRDVQQQLFSIRTMPFGSLSERFYRLARQTGKELGKRVTLEIHGGQVELDRSVLEKLAGPFEHLVRNAIDHGLEGREERRAAGKPDVGRIEVSVRQQGNEVVIELADDGGGIDFARLRARARELGLLGAAVEPTESQLVELMFSSGFTTAREVTKISGRGIGLDVVRNDISALGGRIEVKSEAGKGTTFVLVLPLTLAVAQAALVRVAGRAYAIPAPMVEQVQQLKSEELIEIYQAGRYPSQGRSYPFYYLGRLLGDGEHLPDADRYNAVLLVRSGANVIAVHVDEMIGNQEVVVKNIGPQLSRVTGITGATVLGNGDVVLIINPVRLALRLDALAAAQPGAPGIGTRVPQARPAARALRVLVVDDSLTVRKITSRFLSREGFEVSTARDGVEALQLLGEELPDTILLDIEMPRMDGFEFAKAVKSDPRTAGIPIVMITSRTADKHRQRAQELGVEDYLGKPYQEEALLAAIRRCHAPAGH